MEAIQFTGYITGTNLQGGSLFYSTDDGVTRDDVGAVSDSSTRFLYGFKHKTSICQQQLHGSISDAYSEENGRDWWI